VGQAGVIQLCSQAYSEPWLERMFLGVVQPLGNLREDTSCSPCSGRLPRWPTNDWFVGHVTCRVVELQFNPLLCCSAGKFTKPPGITCFGFFGTFFVMRTLPCNAVQTPEDSQHCEEAFAIAVVWPTPVKSGAGGTRPRVLRRKSPRPLPAQ